MSKHSPTPWRLDNGNIVDRCGCTIDDPLDEADKPGIVTCVNACEGINPEAVPEMVAACATVLDLLDRVVGWEDDTGYVCNVDWRPSVAVLRAALAKARSTP